MIEFGVVNRAIEEIARDQKITVIEYDDIGASGLRVLVQAAGALIPGVGTVASELLGKLNTVSITAWLPLVETVVLLSEAACSTPERKLITFAHELCHCKQIEAVGGPQATVNYLGSGKLRARAEADGAATGMWVQYLLTGALPDPNLAVSKLAGELYHLPAEDLGLAEESILGHLDSMREGGPNLKAARLVEAWLLKHAPGEIRL